MAQFTHRLLPPRRLSEGPLGACCPHLGHNTCLTYAPVRPAPGTVAGRSVQRPRWMNEGLVAERPAFRMDVYTEDWVKAHGSEEAPWCNLAGALFLWVSRTCDREQHASLTTLYKEEG